MRRPGNVQCQQAEAWHFFPQLLRRHGRDESPERWDANWDQNRILAVMADEAGIEFLLPIARWIGYGGDTDFQNNTLEMITWATGLLASTRRMTIFATAHAAFTHPIVAAKQFATMDQIGGGRFGLNVVWAGTSPNKICSASRCQRSIQRAAASGRNGTMWCGKSGAATPHSIGMAPISASSMFLAIPSLSVECRLRP
jgi:hypothetical protein